MSDAHRMCNWFNAHPMCAKAIIPGDHLTRTDFLEDCWVEGLLEGVRLVTSRESRFT